MRVVMKFGGTSVGSADAMRRVVEIVRREAREHQVVVVVSAMNAPDLRTTDTLIAAARSAAAGNGAAFADIAPRLLALHMEAAGELATPFKISLPAVSQHLKVLREAQLVLEERKGRQIIYCLTPEPLRAIYQWVDEFGTFWNSKLDALERHLEGK